MKAFTERRPLTVGIVALAVLGIAVLAVLFLNRNIFSSGYDISAKFPNAAGIGKGTQVLVAGVDVGQVNSVAIKGNAVDVQMTVHNGVVLPHRTAAAIEVETLLGTLDVTLEPRSGWDQPLRSGADITDTSVPTEFYQLNNAAGHLLGKTDIKAVNAVVESLATITAGKQQQVAEIITGLGKLTTTVSDRSAAVSQLIDSANVLATTLASHDQQLAGAVTSLNTVASGLAAKSATLATLIDNVDSMATQTNSLVSQDSPELDALVNQLDTVLGVVDQHQDDLAEAVSYLGGAIKGFASIGYSGPTDTPNQWANIYVNPLGITSLAGPLGACGVITTVLNVALGTTPLPCATRTGPLPGATASNASTTTARDNTGGASQSSATTPTTAAGIGGTSTPTTTPSAGSGTGSSSTPLSSPDSGASGLAQLFSGLLGGSS